MKMGNWLVFLNWSLALMSWALVVGAAQAQDPKALSDGAALLQALDRSNPAHNRLFQEVDKRLPESAKRGNDESPLLMNPPDRLRKLATGEKSKFIFIKKPDGTVGVADRSRVSKALTSTVTHLTKHEDFPGLFRANYKRLKAEHEKALDKVKKKGGWKGIAAGIAGRFAAFPAPDAPPSVLRDYAKDAWGAAYSSVMRRIDEASNKVKKEELARIERGDPQPEPKPVQLAGEPEEAEDGADPEPAQAAAPQDGAPDGTGRNRDRAIRTLDGLFDDLDREFARFEQRTKQDLALCEKATNALAPDSRIGELAQLAKDKLILAKAAPTLEKIDDGAVSDQLRNMFETIRSTNRLSKDAGANACKTVDGAAVASLGQEADKAANLAVLADQLSAAAQVLAQPMIERLSKAVASSLPERSLIQDFASKRTEAYAPLAGHCRALEKELEPIAAKIRADGSLTLYMAKREQGDLPKNRSESAFRAALNKAKWGAIGEHRGSGKSIEGYKQLSELDKLTYSTRIANYEARLAKLMKPATNCTTNTLNAVKARCSQALDQGKTAAKDAAEYAAAAKAQKQIHQAKLANIRAQLGDIERAAKQARTASQQARAYVQQAESKAPNPQTVADAAAVADLSAISCDVAEFDRRIVELRAAKFKGVSGISQHIANLESKRNGVQAAHAKFNEGKARFDAGDPAAAAVQLRAARTELDKLGGVPQCPTLSGRVERGERQAQQLGEILSSADTALKTCKSAAISATLRLIGGKKRPPKLADLKGRLAEQQKVLGIVGQARAAYRAGKYQEALSLLSQAKAEKRKANKDCPIIDQRIDNATAAVEGKRDETDGAARVADAARTCDMVSLRSFFPGHGGITKALKAQADDALQVCRAKEEDRQARAKADQLAARKAKCRADHGAGYYPGKPSADGSYYCIPTRETANRWCRENNPGTGSRAVNIKQDGTHGCKANRKVQRAAARADCRRQIRNSGKVYAYTRINRNGTYDCFSCEPGFRWRKGRCRQRGGNRRRAGGGRFRPGKYKCTISSPDGSLLGGGGSTRTVITNRPMRGPGIRCRRIR